MGHKGDIEETYTRREGMVDEGRLQYQKCLQFLETERKPMQDDESKLLLKEAMLSTFEVLPGNRKLTEEEKEEIFRLSIEEFQEKLREMAEKNKTDSINNGNRFKTIPESELESYLNNKWELGQIYPSGDKAVVKLS